MVSSTNFTNFLSCIKKPFDILPDSVLLLSSSSDALSYISRRANDFACQSRSSSNLAICSSLQVLYFFDDDIVARQPQSRQQQLSESEDIVDPLGRRLAARSAAKSPRSHHGHGWISIYRRPFATGEDGDAPTLRREPGGEIGKAPAGGSAIRRENAVYEQDGRLMHANGPLGLPRLHTKACHPVLCKQCCPAPADQQPFHD